MKMKTNTCWNSRNKHMLE